MVHTSIYSQPPVPLVAAPSGGGPLSIGSIYHNAHNFVDARRQSLLGLASVTEKH